MLPKIILGIGLFATMFAILMFSCKIPVGKCKTEGGGTVVVWGTIPESTLSQIFQKFNATIKIYRIEYKFIPEQEFNQTLLEAIASNSGPDAILAPQQIIISQSNRIAPFAVKQKDFQDAFVDGASIFLVPNAALALPVTVEPMVLFYNRTLLSKHGVLSPPTSWSEVLSVVPSLTVKQGSQFLESGIALGSPTVPYTKDILMAIVAQLGQIPVTASYNEKGAIVYNFQADTPVPARPDIRPLTAAVRYITQFGDTGQAAYTWSQSQVGEPADAFVGEKLAMYIGYSGEFKSLKARNPRADFQISVFPQSQELNSFTTGMRMYAFATLRTAKNPDTARVAQSAFASVALSPDISAAIGALPPFRSYAGMPSLDPVLARSMVVAKGWYDVYSKDSSLLTSRMVSDIINHREGVTDAVTAYSNRMFDLYKEKY